MNHKNQSSTIADVARLAGVSIATVSRVINGNTPVVASTAERVQAAIKELNFVPRTAARVLASRRTNTIGLLLPEIGGWFFPSILRGIESAARQAGFDLLIHTVDVDYPLKTSRRALGMHNTDGLIVFTNSVGDEELSYLEQSGFPIVLLHQTPPENLNIPVITIENKDGAQKLVDHLIEVHGCRRIAFLRGPEGHEDSKWRERGYRESLEAHGIPFDETLIATGGFDESEADCPPLVNGWWMDWNLTRSSPVTMMPRWEFSLPCNEPDAASLTMWLLSASTMFPLPDSCRRRSPPSAHPPNRLAWTRSNNSST